MDELIGLRGFMSIYELPEDWTDEELRYWWDPEMTIGADGILHLVHSARISDTEKERWKVLEVENLITNGGYANFLSNLSVPGQGGYQLAICEIFSVGNGAITGVLPTDTAVAGDGFGTNSRKAWTSGVNGGFLPNVTISFASGDANGNWTNAGWYGTNATTGQHATTTAGTGQLMTHALCNYTKGAIAVAVTYTFKLAN